jgi:hypothetical protein
MAGNMMQVGPAVQGGVAVAAIRRAAWWVVSAVRLVSQMTFWAIMDYRLARVPAGRLEGVVAG